MNLLFSFLEPNRPHSALLAGYFSKVCFVYTINRVYVIFLAQCLLYLCFGQSQDLNVFCCIVGCYMSHVAEDDSTYEFCSSE